MKLVGIYLKEHIPALVLLAFFSGVFALVFALYGLPVQAVAYPALICLFLGAVAAAARFARWKRRHTLLQMLRSEISETVEGLPAAGCCLEADYQALLQALHREKTDLAGRMEQKYRDTTEYFCLWAHQIKTPIAAMRLVLQEEESDRNRELQAQLQAVEQYVEMAMCYLRLDSSTTDFVIRTYALDAVVRQAVKKYASQFIRRHIRLDYAPLDVQVLTDEKGLFFIVDQVLSNALKYTREGGAVSVYLEAPKTLCIADTGIGIAAEDLPRIFDRGYTGLNGRRDKKASGIGLYLCRRIAAQLGHTITVESAVGTGTVVRIALDREKICLE